MSLHDNVFKLQQVASSQGLHGGDILLELKQVTLASGTAECPTSFKNGQILAVFITDNSASITAVNSTVAFATDMVVATGAITINGPTASTLTVSVLILGRLEL
jgi:hypothetical protein